MFSNRFNKQILVTDHAKTRMLSRLVDDAMLLDLIETGELRNKDATRIWIAKSYADRADNLICVAASAENLLVIKTVMHHFSWEPKK